MQSARLRVPVPSDPEAIEEFVVLRNGRVAYRITTYPAALEETETTEVEVVPPSSGPHLRIVS